jgi:hypothetical protein
MDHDQRTVGLVLGDELLGAGTIITADRVLTARGFLPMGSAGLVVDGLMVLRGEQRVSVRGIVWEGGDAMDAAVLDVALDGVVPGDPLAVLSPRSVESEPWCASGVGWINNGRELHLIRRMGTTFPRADVSSDVTLDISTAERSTENLSGAAIWIGQHIVALFGSGMGETSGRQVTAVLVMRLFECDDFLAAIGVTQKVNDELKQLRDAVRETLKAHARLCAALAKQFNVAPEFAAVTDAVMGSTAFEVIRNVNRADSDLAKLKPATLDDRIAVKELANRVFPYAYDRRKTVLAARAAIEKHQRSGGSKKGCVVEVSAAKLTIIEAVMAGAHARPVMFREVRSGRGLVGKGYVPKPAAMEAPVMDIAEEALVKLLSEELNLGEIKGDRVRAINEALEYRAIDAADDERLRYYFVLDEKDQELAGLFERLIRDQFVELHLVKPGEDSDDDYKIELALKDLYNRS